MKKTVYILIISLLIIPQLLAVLDFGVKGVTGTSVSEHITSDTVWISSASPYWIEGNVTVDEGVTLYIESGVEVRFNGSYSLFVEGNLKAIGEKSNVINFTSNKTSPSEGDWSSIHINSTGHLEMDYCIVQYGNRSITLFNTSNNKITNSTITSSYDRGIYLYNSSFNTISDCEVSIHTYGIYLESAFNNTIQDCKMLSNGARGLYLRHSTYNEITRCNVSNNGRNVYLTTSSNNSITKSYISGGYEGIKVMHSSNWNEVHHNSFVNNVIQANDSYTNYWDDGAEGNYWSDYSGSDADGDGIGDVPYVIPGGSNNDSYPLMAIPDFTPPVINEVAPPNLTENITITVNIVVEFSEPMNKSATQNAFTLEAKGIIVSGTFNWNDFNDTMTFNPTADLIGETTYWINITTSAADIAGNALLTPWSSSFTTKWDVTPPIIIDIIVIPDPQEVNGYVNISANVSDNVGVDSVRINITDPNGDTMGNFTTTYDSVTGRYYENQSYDIIGIYHFIIFANDTSDNWNSSSGQFRMQDATLPTVSSTLPTNGQIDVPINTTITITFSEPMNKTAVQSAITISSGLIPTSFDWSNENRTLTFIPSSDLNFDTQYTTIINASVAEDISGNKLDGNKDGVGLDDYNWSFVTGVGIISGVVKDNKGNPIPNAIVTVYYLNGSVARSTITNESGNYTINVSPGTYDIKVEKKGYETQWERGVFVRVGQEIDLQITMTISNNLLSEYWWVVLLVSLAIIVTIIMWILMRRKS